MAAKFKGRAKIECPKLCGVNKCQFNFLSSYHARGAIGGKILDF